MIVDKAADPAELQELLAKFMHAEVRATYPSPHFGGRSVHPLYVSADGPMLIEPVTLIDFNAKQARSLALSRFEDMLAALRANDWVSTRAPRLEFDGQITSAVWTLSGMVAYPEKTLVTAHASLELCRANGLEPYGE